jgi:hypothetical protein
VGDTAIFANRCFEDRGYWDMADCEKVVDAKIEELKGHEQSVNWQMEELHRLREALPN